MPSIIKWNAAKAHESAITTISLANSVLQLTCIGEQDLRTICTTQRQVACFKLALEHLHRRSSYRIILIPQAQTLLVPPPLLWRTGIVHITNPFNPHPMKILVWTCEGPETYTSAEAFQTSSVPTILKLSLSWKPIS